MAKTGTTALLPDQYDAFTALARAGLRDEELGIKFGFSWATARKYRIKLAPETQKRVQRRLEREAEGQVPPNRFEEPA